MYIVNSTFTNARLEKNFNEGLIDPLKELTNNEIEHLKYYSFISEIDSDDEPEINEDENEDIEEIVEKPKNKRGKTKRAIDGEDSST